MTHNLICVLLLLLQIVVDLKALTVTEGTTGSADVTINIGDEDFILVGTKQLNIEDASAQGKIEIIGDKALAAALIEQIK